MPDIMDRIRQEIEAGREAACRDCEYKMSCDTCAWHDAVELVQRVSTVDEFLHELDGQCCWCRMCRLVGCDWFNIFKLVMKATKEEE